MKEIYEQRKEKYEKEKKNADSKSTWVANFRLVAFTAIIFSILKGYKGDSTLYNSTAVIGLVTFIALVAFHNGVKQRIKKLDKLIEVNERYLKRIAGEWSEFEDIGEEFVDPNHPYSSDLDIFGKYSLFQYLNLANTETGREIFSKSLSYPEKDIETIKKRSEGIDELSSKHDFVQMLETISSMNAKDLKSPDKLIEYAESNKKIFKSDIVKYIIKVLPVITIAANLTLIWTKEYGLIALGLVVLQSVLWLAGVLKNQDALSIVNYLKFNLETYAAMLKEIEVESFETEYLSEIKNSMFKDKSSSLVAIKELGRITELVNIRIQGIMNIILNVFLLWDYQCVFMLEKWKDKYGSEVKEWVYGIGEFESLMSFAQIPNIVPGTNNAVISEGNFIESKGLGHILIHADKRVANDISMKDEIFVITGSNMSGKTTFLRTIGINLVLAYNGARCVCESLNAGVMDIYTSMRIIDDLGEGISTFYAEILRIKKIIDRAEENPRMIFLIDEIFRGTNSVDRIAGAKNVIANLKNLGVIGAVSTHDLELCALDDGKRVFNYHFADTYDGESITFDYKIKKGASTSTNAKNLMKLAGIKMVIE